MRYKVLFTGDPGVTEKGTLGDTAALLTSYCTVDTTKEIIGVLISVETNPIRFAFNGTTPTQGAAGVGHKLSSGQSMKLTNTSQVETMRVINHDNGSNAILQITLEYNV
jgi:hypothetical protein